MSVNWDELSDTPPNKVNWDELSDTPPEKGGPISDTVTAIGQGTLQIPGMVNGLADIPFGMAGIDRPISKIANTLTSKVGITNPSILAKNTNKDYSPEMQQQDANVDAVWKDPSTNGFDVAQSYVENPLHTYKSIVTSLPSMGLGGVLGRSLLASGLVKSAPLSAGAGEGAVMAGQSMDSITGNIDPRKRAMASAGVGVLGGAIGTLTGQAANRLGFTDIDQAIATGGASGVGNASISLPKRLIHGAIQEGPIEEGGQSIAETGLQNYAENKPITEGMGRNYVEGTVAGTAMGIGSQLISNPAINPPETDPNQQTNNTQIPPPPNPIPSGHQSSYDHLFQQSESNHGLPAGLLSTMGFHESGFNPDAVSPVGARGVMQFMPGTAKEYGIDPHDPVASIDAAGAKMAGLRDYYNGDMQKAVAAYNYGEGNLNKAIAEAGDNWLQAVPVETQNYVSKILGDQSATTSTQLDSYQGSELDPLQAQDSLNQQAQTLNLPTENNLGNTGITDTATTGSDAERNYAATGADGILAGANQSEGINNEQSISTDPTQAQSQSAPGHDYQITDETAKLFEATHELNDGTPVKQIDSDTYVDQAGDEWSAYDAVPLKPNQPIADATPSTQQENLNGSQKSTDETSQNAHAQEKGLLNKTAPEQSGATSNIDQLANDLHTAIKSGPDKAPGLHYADIVNANNLDEQQRNDLIDKYQALATKPKSNEQTSANQSAVAVPESPRYETAPLLNKRTDKPFKTRPMAQAALTSSGYPAVNQKDHEVVPVTVAGESGFGIAPVANKTEVAPIINQPLRTQATETVALPQETADLSNNDQANNTTGQAPATKANKRLGLAITQAAKIENRTVDDIPGSYNQGSEHQGIQIHSINQTQDANGKPDYIVDVSNHTRVASNGHKTVDGKYSLNELLSSGAISQKTHDFLVDEHNQSANTSPEISNDHELTAKQYVDRENKDFPGNKKISDSLRNIHYTAIKSQADRGGKISQAVFDSLDGLKRTNLKQKYGEAVVEGNNDERAKAQDELKSALSDVGIALSDKTSFNAVPNDIVLKKAVVRLVNAAIKLGYITLKSNVSYVMAQLTEKFGAKASAISLDYIAEQFNEIHGAVEDKALLKDTVNHKSVSTRIPSAVNAKESPFTNKLIVGLKSSKGNPEAFEKNINLVTGYSNYRETPSAVTIDQKAERFINHVRDNLLWLYDQVPSDIRSRSKLWYEGARHLVDQWTTTFGYTDTQIAGVMAVLSPQKDWFMNVSLAERILDASKNQQNTPWSKEMDKVAAVIFEKEQYAQELADIKGKSLEEVVGARKKSMWIRTFDQAHNNRGHRIVTPEGGFSEFVTNKDGVTEATTGWGSLSEIAKAVAIIEDGSIKNISKQLGEMHKVRNFYNNIINPNDKLGSVTIDTHAVAAGLLKGLSGNSAEVSHNFGSAGASSSAEYGSKGTYGLLADAYRRAAKMRGILPREMQSITWEAVRGLFSAGFKAQQKNVDAINAVWDQYQKKRISLDETRKQITQIAGSEHGIPHPDWVGHPSGTHEKARYSSYQGELSGSRLSGGNTRVDSGTGSNAAGAVSKELVSPLDSAIKFSKSLPANTLAIVHNLSLENLIHADRVGGLAVPSVAVVNKDHPMDSFGEISLIANKDTLGPQASNKNKYFNADVYSPRYPNVTYIGDQKAIDKANDNLSETAKKIQQADDWSSRITAERLDRGLVKGLGDNLALQYQYLESLGKAPALTYKPKTQVPKSLRKFITKDIDLRGVEFGRAALDEWNATHPNKPDVDFDISAAIRSDAANTIEKARRELKLGKVIDTSALLGKVRSKVDQKEFNQWITDNYSNLIKDEKIFDGFTNSGTRRYLPHNLDTVVKLMTKSVRGGENFNYGVGSIRAHAAKQFKTIKSLQDARTDLISNEKMDELKDEVAAEFESISEALEPYRNEDAGYSNQANEALADLAGKGLRAFQEYYTDVPADVMNEVYDFMNQLKNMPSHYFEGKIGRSVGINEFEGAIVPSGKAYDKAIEILKKNGITNIKRYTSNNNESRSAALKSFNDLLFSKSKTSIANPHTKTTLSQAITNAMDKLFGNGWTNRLMATGKFKVISAAEAAGIIGHNAMFHKVWHGTPHDHNKFDSTYIGTGEGNQAFGWGHYFSDAKRIAEWYRSTLSSAPTAKIGLLGSKKIITSDDFLYPEISQLFNNTQDLKSLLEKANERINTFKEDIRLDIEYSKKHGQRVRKESEYPASRLIDQLTTDIKFINKIEAAGGLAKSGKLYEVELAPTQDEYLDWRKPLSQQSDTIKAALEKLHKQLDGDNLDNYLERLNADWNELTGQELYQKILQRGHQDDLFNHPDIYDRYVPDDEASSHLLHSLGIRGIRYKAESGNSEANNYVVFSDSDVKIEAKYSKNGDVVAFYNPADDTTYLVHDNMAKDMTDKALQGLMLHEVGVHALQLGKSNEAFQEILRRFEALKKTNPKVQAAFDRVPGDTKAGDITEEALAYYLEANPKSSLAQRIIEWFRQAVRAIGKALPVLERAKFNQWANKLTESELIGMATSALKSAPNSLQIDNVGSQAAGKNIAQQDNNSSDIKFSRSNTTEINQSIKEAFSKVQGKPALGWLGGLFQRNHLIDFVAKDLPELINYKLLSQAKDNFINQYQQDIAKSYESMQKKLGDWKTGNKVMHELGRVQSMATRLENFDPSEATENTPMTDEERDVFDAYDALPQGAKDVYVKMRDDYRADLMAKKRALKDRIAAFSMDIDTKAKILKEIEDHFDQFLNRGVYFPLSRHGNIIVMATNRYGEKVTEFVESDKARDKLIADMKVEGYKDFHTTLKNDYNRDLLAGNAANDMAVLAKRTISNIQEKATQGTLTDADFNTLFSEFNQLLINTLPDSSYRKHFIHRKGTLGESTDTLRAYAKTRTSAIKAMASLKYDHKIEKVLSTADKAIKEMDKEVDSDTRHIKSILNELRSRESALKNTEIQPWAQWLTSLGFVGALGFNIGSAAVNMLQVPGVALPELSGRYGFFAANKALLSASKLVFNPSAMNWTSGFDITKNPALSSITKQAMQHLSAIGKIDLTMTHDAIAAGQNPSYSSNSATRLIGNTAKYSGYLFHVAEAINRQVTGMAAFDLAYKKNGGDFNAAINEAVDIIDRTQFDYGQGNRSRYMMSNPARVLFLFKSYALGMSYFIGRNAALSINKLPSEERRQARKTLVTSLAMSFATAGLFGMPIGMEAFAAIGGVAGFKYKGANFSVPGAIGGLLIFQVLLAGLGADDEDDLETEFRNWLTDNFNQTVAEFMTKGPMRILPIGDISGRTDTAHLWWRPQNKQLEGTDQYNAIASALMGPLGSQAAGLFTAKKMYEDGEYSRMMESMSPAFLRNAIAANRMNEEGVRNLKGDKLVERDLTANELLNKVIGFNPKVIANAYDANSAITKERDKISMAKSHLVNRYIDGDAADRSALMRGDIKTFNEGVASSERITLKSLINSIKHRKGSDRHTKNGLYLSRRQEHLRNIGRFAESE